MSPSGVRRFPLLLAIAVAASVLLRASWFVISVKNVPAYDDECKIALQALDIAHGRDFPLLILASPYIFPLDAYLTAPAARFLPRDAIGTRTVPWFLGLGSMAAGLLLLRMGGRWRDVWPGVLMVLFPSAYLLMLQSALLLPAYTPLMLFGPLAVWLALRRPESARAFAWTRGLSGLASGLACSGTMLSAPFLAASGLVAVLQPRWRRAGLAAAFFAAGAALGLAPHLAAKHAHRGAFEAVSQQVPARAAMAKLGSPVLERTLPAALGVSPPIFPDHRTRMPRHPGWERPVGIFWLAALAAASAWAAIRFVRDWRRARAPAPTFDQPFILISWLCLALFLFSARSHAHTYRYLVPAVLSWPLVLAGLHAYSGRAVRAAVAIVAGGFLVFHLHGTRVLLQHWNRPEFASELTLYDQEPVLRYLRERGIRHALATYSDAYRITYRTDRAILCGQPYNERFPGWPVPYKDEIDAAPRVAFVLSDAYKFPPEDFENDCARAGVRYRMTPCGDYRVYTDFSQDRDRGERRLDRRTFTARASHNPAESGRLADGLRDSRWHAHSLQQTNHWIEVSWPESARISRVAMDLTGYSHDRAKAVRVLARGADGWRTVVGNAPKKFDPFEWANGHPVYGTRRQTYRFPAVTADAVRIEIVEPQADRDWTIGEIEVYGPADPEVQP